jgi:hypothetical protein
MKLLLSYGSSLFARFTIGLATTGRFVVFPDRVGEEADALDYGVLILGGNELQDLSEVSVEPGLDLVE